jgi:hypothetical protein
MDWNDLDRLIEQFGSMVAVATASFRYEQPDWKVIWSKSTEIQNGFREARYPTRQQRDDAWTRFSTLRQEASGRADRDHDERRSQSEYHRDIILHQIDSAGPTTLVLFGDPDIAEMKHLGQVLNEARKMLSANKAEMLGEHKQECFTRIQDVQESHDAWWVHLKQIRSTERRDRIRSNLEENHERHRKASDALDSYRSRADALRAKIASAWNPSWAEGASERLAEIEEKIEDIEESLERIEDWIQKDEERLEDLDA